MVYFKVISVYYVKLYNIILYNKHQIVNSMALTHSGMLSYNASGGHRYDQT